MNVWEKLAYPFDEKFVKWFNKGGHDLAYLDARDVMDRLDQVIGHENWTDKYVETASGRVICTITIAVDINGKRYVIEKSDGAGDTSIEGEKGGISDAFKRAAAKFGVGRYLYRLAGPSNVTGRLPDWALPGGPPPPSAYADFPEEPETENTPPQNPNHQNVTSLDKAKSQMKMIEEFAKLQERGIDQLGLEKYTELVNVILEGGYGGKNWKDEDIDLDVARSMFKDISNAIENAKGAS